MPELTKLEKAALETVEDAFPDYLKFLEKFQKTLERLDRYKRRNFSVTLATPTIEALKWFAEHIKDDEGNSYPISYIIEDMIIWILKDPIVFATFVGDMYQTEEVDEYESISSEEKAKD